MGEDGFHFPAIDAWEPLEELFHRRTVLEILEECGQGHARPAEHPSSTELIRDPFDCGAPLPICRIPTPMGMILRC